MKKRSVLEAAGRVFRTRGVSRRVADISISAIKEMPLLAADVPGAVSLGQGIPSFPTPEHIRAAAIEALTHDPSAGKYTLQPGLPRLKQAAARELSRAKGVEIDGDRELFVSTGSMEALFAAMMTVLEPGDEILMPSPNYASHVEQARLAGADIRWVPLLEEGGWRLDLEAITRAVSDRTRAVILSSPQNPTGMICSEAEVRALADLCLKMDMFLISDEAYDFMVYDSGPAFSPASIPELKDNLIACYSFSKKYAMTGWRVGLMYASVGIIDQALKVHDALTISAPTVSQLAALAALEGPQDCVSEMTALLKRRRDLTCRRLDRLAPVFTYQRPKGAYYVFVRFNLPGLDSYQLALALLYEAGVITIPGGAFGPTGDSFLRLSFGGEEAEIGLAFDRIENWLEKKGYR